MECSVMSEDGAVSHVELWLGIFIKTTLLKICLVWQIHQTFFLFIKSNKTCSNMTIFLCSITIHTHNCQTKRIKIGSFPPTFRSVSVEGVIGEFSGMTHQLYCIDLRDDLVMHRVIAQFHRFL
jgi:hypothetical protein